MAEEATQPAKKAPAKKVPAKKTVAKKMAAKVETPVEEPVVAVVSQKPDQKEALKSMISSLKAKSAQVAAAKSVEVPLDGGAGVQATVAAVTKPKKAVIPVNKPLAAALHSVQLKSNDPSAVVVEAKKDSSILANLTLRRGEDKSTSWEVYLNDPSKAYKDKFTSSRADVYRDGIASDDISAWLDATQGFSLGVIPEGVRFVHKYKDRIRIVLELPPGEYLTFWGLSESSKKEKYMLGCPYKLAVADFKGAQLPNGKTGWSLFGCRMFFSLVPMTSWDTPLYHTSFNNTNCKGYGDTGIGWTCFYHAGENATTLKGIVNVVHHRVGGGEAYNEYNMPHTQGADFYKANRPNHTHLHGPVNWEKKTEKEGIDWVWNPDQWIPIIPDTEELQLSHDMHKRNPDQSQLTIGRAVFSKAPMYYSHRGGGTPDDFYQSLLNNPYTDYTPPKSVERVKTFDELFV